jgi:ABC-2 type transport system ATP-binding protein
MLALHSLTMPAESPAIEVHDLVKTYAGLTAVNKVSFTVARGEILGFLGPNGAGKSTTMRILTGYLPASAGSVAICGVSVATHGQDVKKLIGYMPENNPLPDDMRVGEYLYYRGRLKEIPRARLSFRIDEVIDLCDLRRVKGRIIGTLSKGFRQRVGIAEAILAEPPIIIMDEPTIGLDPHQILIVRDLIASLRGRMTVIISSHILPEIEMTCDRVLIINQGRVVAQGTPADLRREVFGHARYALELASEPSEALTACLTTVEPSLKIITTTLPDTAGFCSYALTADRDDDLGEPILRALAGSGFRVRSLHRAHPTLEDVFLAATKRGWDTPEAPGIPRPS